MNATKFAVIGLALASSATFADELVVTQQEKGGTHAIAIDYVSEGKAAAFEFRIEVPGGATAKVSLEKCMEGLPKSHLGQCTFAKGHIIGLVYNDSNEPFPAGVHKIGRVYVSGAGAGKPVVNHFLAADAKADKLPSVIRDGGAAK